MKESIIRSILNNLGFSQTEIVKNYHKFKWWRSYSFSNCEVIYNPKILILDEPTNFIDVQTIEALEVLVKVIKELFYLLP